jgi:hypothetical protein
LCVNYWGLGFEWLNVSKGLLFEKGSRVDADNCGFDFVYLHEVPKSGLRVDTPKLFSSFACEKISFLAGIFFAPKQIFHEKEGILR